MHCVLLLAGVLLWQACFLHMTGCHDRMRLWVLLHRIAILLQATLGTVLCQSKSPGFWFTGKSDTMVGVTRNFLSSSRPKEFFYVLRRLLRPAGARGIICARALCCAHFCPRAMTRQLSLVSRYEVSIRRVCGRRGGVGCSRTRTARESFARTISVHAVLGVLSERGWWST